MGKKENHKCRVSDCNNPATCHIYEEEEIIHLCLEHYKEKEVNVGIR